jgi:hypothetical protein
MESKKYNFVGTCVNSFDDDSCTFYNYRDVSDFATGESNAKNVSKEVFMSNVNWPDDIELSKRVEYLYDKSHDVYMVYDLDSDVHYFCVKSS